MDDSLLKAPRNLNEPVRCRTSGLRKTFAPVRSQSTGGDHSGVRITNGAITPAAASTSAELTGMRERGSFMVTILSLMPRGRQGHNLLRPMQRSAAAPIGQARCRIVLRGDEFRPYAR